MLLKILPYLFCINILLEPIYSINQQCKQQSLSSKCPSNSFCNDQGFCECQDGWVLNCSLPSSTITQKERIFSISQSPSHFTVVPSSDDSIYVYRFYMCVEGSETKVSLNLSLFADQGTQIEFTKDNLIGQIKLDTVNECWPLFSPYMLFGKQPNGKMQQMVLQINKYSRQSFVNIRIENNQMILTNLPQKKLNVSEQSSVKLKLSVNQIYFINMNTLWLIIIIFISVITVSFIAGIAYCIFAVRRGRRSLARNGFFDNNLSHFQQLLPKYKIKQNDPILHHCCPVCLLDFQVQEQVRKTQCTHIFHSECLDVWCKKNLICPVCRTGLQKNQLQQKKSQVQMTSGTINGTELEQQQDLQPQQLSPKRKQNMRQRLIN